MACGPCAARRKAAAARAGQVQGPTPSSIEYVVVTDGVYSEPFATYAAASAYSNANGGQVRSRAKIN